MERYLIWRNGESTTVSIHKTWSGGYSTRIPRVIHTLVVFQIFTHVHATVGTVAQVLGDYHGCFFFLGFVPYKFPRTRVHCKVSVGLPPWLHGCLLDEWVVSCSIQIYAAELILCDSRFGILPGKAVNLEPRGSGMGSNCCSCRCEWNMVVWTYILFPAGWGVHTIERVSFIDGKFVSGFSLCQTRVTYI